MARQCERPLRKVPTPKWVAMRRKKLFTMCSSNSGPAAARLRRNVIRLSGSVDDVAFQVPRLEESPLGFTLPDGDGFQVNRDVGDEYLIGRL